MKKYGRIFTTALAVLVGLGGIPFTGSLNVQAQTGSFTAEDLTLQPGSDTTKINVNWYADAATTDAKVRFQSASQIITADAGESAATTGKTACKATVSGLAKHTTYTYQVSNDGGSTWSDAYTYVTPDAGNFSFAFVGDPQLNHGSEDSASNAFSSDKSTKQGWNDTVNAISGKKVNFIASAGDQVDDSTGGSEAQYTDFFSPGALTSTPFAAAVGNHDRNPGFLFHYNLPNEQDVSALVNTGTTPSASDVTADNGNYYYSYNNALFVVLNDASYPASKDEAAPYIAAFRQTLSAAKAAFPDSKWIFVQHHKSTESVGQHCADKDIEYYVEAGFEKLMDEYHVDFVLAGHDHVYARTYVMKDGVRTSENANYYEDPAGTIYVTCNTASGLKYYNIFDSAKIYVKDNALYPLLANGLTGSAEYLKGVYPISTAVAAQTKIPGYSIIHVNGDTVTFDTYSTYDNPATADVNETTVSSDSFTVKKDAAPSSRTQGSDNATSDLSAELAARYQSYVKNENGGSTEIVEYNTDNKKAYGVNGTTGSLVITDLSGVTASKTTVDTLPAVHIPVKSIVNANVSGFSYGDMTSVAISTKYDIIALAIQSSDYAAKGIIAIFDYNGKFLRYYDAGVQPDMVTVDDSRDVILSANEGEPRLGTGGVDPMGSVTMIQMGTGAVKTADFTSFDSKRDSLTQAGVVIRKNTSPSTDLEPEYISVTGGKAYVSLQENNAVAVFDIDTGSFDNIFPVGLEDYSKTAIDLGNGDSTYLPSTYGNLYGLRMPDGIATYTANGKTYLLTANEGDSRADWSGLDNEVKSKTSTAGDITLAKKVTWFNTALYDGVSSGKNYLFGGRSVTLFEVTATGLKELFTSGAQFEAKTAALYPANFDCSNNNTTLEDRSGKKGVEPENVTVGVVGSRTYAYIGLERIGGIMMYDITNPSEPFYANYINSRDFGSAIAGDVSPEGMCFVAAADSAAGTPLLLTANEVSGTITAYALKTSYADYSVLNQTIAAVPADLTKYTKDSVASLKKLLASVKKDLLRSAQGQVNQMNSDIANAIENLKLSGSSSGSDESQKETATDSVTLETVTKAPGDTNSAATTTSASTAAATSAPSSKSQQETTKSGEVEGDVSTGDHIQRLFGWTLVFGTVMGLFVCVIEWKTRRKDTKE